MGVQLTVQEDANMQMKSSTYIYILMNIKKL